MLDSVLMPSLPNVKFLVPTAPERVFTLNGNRSTAWFDVMFKPDCDASSIPPPFDFIDLDECVCSCASYGMVLFTHVRGVC